MPRPFHHIYGEHGLYVTNEFRYNHTNSIAAAISACEDYMLGWYLDLLNFDTVDEYADYITEHPDEMDTLAVFLTTMLNKVHISIFHKDGKWHTHGKGCCACVLHFAYMGEHTYMALEHVKKNPEQANVPANDERADEHPATQSTSAQMKQPAAEPNDKTMMPGDTPNNVSVDAMCWVNTMPFMYPQPKSEKFCNRIFRSAACKAAMPTPKSEQYKDKIFHSAAAKATLPPKTIHPQPRQGPPCCKKGTKQFNSQGAAKICKK